ncbi:TonB family protein [Cupriavidus sp. PET2-C1]
MSARSGGRVWLDRQRGLTLARLIKSGGAGSVFLLAEAPAQVAKLYHGHMDLASYQRKIDAMLRLSPELPDQVENGKRYVQIAWPQSPLLDARGRFIGFAMPALDIQQTAELEEILQERQARAAGLPTGLGAKITLAANLSGVIAALHQQHHYVVDLKPVNLRFYRDSLYIAMLDCDGFSIQGESERFAAQQFTADYLAPELQGGGLTAAGEPAQDRFALAVVIFQLLNFGIHPFSGRPANAQLPTDLPGRIRGRYYAYGLRAHKAISPNPVSGHAQMPPELRDMFDSAFAGPPDGRPAPAEWARVLREYALRSSQRLAVCTADPSHQHFAGLACAACARSAMIAGAATQAAAATQAGGKRKSGRGKRARQAAARPPLQQPLQQPLAQAAAVSASISNTMPASGAMSGTFAIAVAVALTLVVLVTAFMSSGGGDSDREAATPAAANGTAGGQGQALEWKRGGAPAASLTLASTRAEIRATIAAVAAGQFDTYRYNLLRLKRMALPSSYNSTREFNRIQRAYGDTLRQARTAAAKPEGGARAAEAELEAHYEQHRELLARDSGAFFSANELGEYHLRLKEPVTARLLFEQAIWARADDPNAWYGLGAVALREQRDKDAVASFAIAERLQAEVADKSGELSAILATLRLRMVSDAKRWETFSQAGKALAARLAELPPLADRQASVDPASQQRHPASYPSTLASRAGGRVDLQVMVDASGDPSQIAVVRLAGPGELGRAAIEAARQWRYQPAVRQGELIGETVMIPVTFAPERPVEQP